MSPEDEEAKGIQFCPDRVETLRNASEGLGRPCSLSHLRQSEPPIAESDPPLPRKLCQYALSPTAPWCLPHTTFIPEA